MPDTISAPEQLPFPTVMMLSRDGINCKQSRDYKGHEVILGSRGEEHACHHFCT